MMARDVVLIGGRCMGRVLIDRLEQDPNWNAVAVIDDGLEVDVLQGIPVRRFDNYAFDCHDAILALSRPEDKRHYQKKAEAIGLGFLTYVDRMAVVGASCKIGEGSVVLPFATVLAGGQLGKFVFLSTYAEVAKDAVVGSYATIMNYSSVRAAQVGEDAVLATAVHVLDGANVGDRAWIAPGTLLRRPVPADHFAGSATPRLRPRSKGAAADKASATFVSSEI
jgi:UDP-3-O-[3-hydroxymyristoyl] glucosamine N-acyltransferase